MEGTAAAGFRDRAARGAGVDRATGRAVAARADRGRPAARGHAARAAGARGEARRLADPGAGEPRPARARRLRRGRLDGARLRQQADARGLRGDLRGAARAGGSRGTTRRGGGRAARAREHAEDARQARASRGRAEDVDAYLALRWEFYGTCYRASGRRRLVEEVERLYWRSERYNRLVLSTAQRFQESLGRYSAFFAHCEANDGLAAERAVQDSLRWAVDSVAGGLPSEAEFT